LCTSIPKFFIVAAKLPTSVAKLPTDASKLHMVASKLDIGVLKMHCIKVTYFVASKLFIDFFSVHMNLPTAIVKLLSYATKVPIAAESSIPLLQSCIPSARSFPPL
jgi:hypothetical protein